MKTENSTSSTQTPDLPALYFANDDETHMEQTPSLETLPSELLHTCLVEYADWGDLAKLACVQKKWKNIVDDAATYGGENATWELSMCLLHGDDKHDDSEKENAKDESEKEAKNNRGLQKNEALAVKYLARLSGVEVEHVSTSDAPKSVLPTDAELSPENEAAHEPALLQLATCHLAGTGLPKPNPTMALHYLTTAYHLTNSVVSAHKLALIYEYPTQSNNQIPIDIHAAFEWFKAAAENGHIPSMAELALCYELGCGVEQSDEEALDWYQKAANEGHAASQYSVGEHFEEARGVRMDHEEACLWYHRAAVLGEEDGVAGLRRLEEVARRVVRNVDEVLNA